MQNYVRTFACVFNVILTGKETRVYHKSDENSLKDLWSIFLAIWQRWNPMLGAFIILVCAFVFKLILTGNEHIFIFLRISMILNFNGQLAMLICFYHFSQQRWIPSPRLLQHFSWSHLLFPPKFWLFTYLNDFPIVCKIPIG